MTIGKIYHGMQMKEEKENRKRQTFELLSKGHSTIEIAQMLKVREQTILNYIRESSSGKSRTPYRGSLGDYIVSAIILLVILVPILIWVWTMLFD